MQRLGTFGLIPLEHQQPMRTLRHEEQTNHGQSDQREEYLHHTSPMQSET